MPNYSVTVTLQAQSGETADNQINTFAFFSLTALDEGRADDYVAHLANLYDILTLSDCLCGIDTNAHVVKFYNAVTTPGNYPLFTKTFNIAHGPSSIDLPLEVSLCISYANDTQTDIAPARRRGRIYISGHKEADNTAGRPTSGKILNVVNAYASFVDDVNTISGFEAGIWSRAEGEVYRIERVWVDNEWDTMRSRGGQSTARSTVMITP